MAVTLAPFNLNMTTPVGVVINPTQVAPAQNNLELAQTILNQLYQFRSTNPAGINRISIDGQEVVFQSLADLDVSIQYWSTRVGILAGTRRRAQNVWLGGF